MVASSDADANRPKFDVYSSTTKTALTTIVNSRSKEDILKHGSSNLSQYNVYYIMVPVLALIVVALVSLMIHLLVRRHRRLMSHHLVPVYHYDPTESNEAGWESELLDDVDPPFVRGNQRPIVRGSLAINGHNENNQTVST